MCCLFISFDIVWFDVPLYPIYTHTLPSNGMWKGARWKESRIVGCIWKRVGGMAGRQAKRQWDGKYHKIEYPNKEVEVEVQFIIMWTHVEGANYNERKRSFEKDSTQWSEFGSLMPLFSTSSFTETNWGVCIAHTNTHIQFGMKFSEGSLAHEPNSDRCNFHHFELKFSANLSSSSSSQCEIKFLFRLLQINRFLFSSLHLTMNCNYAFWILSASAMELAPNLFVILNIFRTNRPLESAYAFFSLICSICSDPFITYINKH